MKNKPRSKKKIIIIFSINKGDEVGAEVANWDFHLDGVDLPV